MGQKLSEPDLELYRRTDEILHFVWDPCGIGGRAGARDEYFAYLPGVFALVKSGASAPELEAHLNAIAQDRMGLTDTAPGAANAAHLLVEWRSSVEESNPAFQRTATRPLN